MAAPHWLQCTSSAPSRAWQTQHVVTRRGIRLCERIETKKMFAPQPPKLAGAADAATRHRTAWCHRCGARRQIDRLQQYCAFQRLTYAAQKNLLCYYYPSGVCDDYCQDREWTPPWFCCYFHFREMVVAHAEVRTDILSPPPNSLWTVLPPDLRKWFRAVYVPPWTRDILFHSLTTFGRGQAARFLVDVPAQSDWCFSCGRRALFAELADERLLCNGRCSFHARPTSTRCRSCFMVDGHRVPLGQCYLAKRLAALIIVEFQDKM